MLNDSSGRTAPPVSADELLPTSSVDNNANNAVPLVGYGGTAKLRGQHSPDSPLNVDCTKESNMLSHMSNHNSRGDASTRAVDSAASGPYNAEGACIVVHDGDGINFEAEPEGCMSKMRHFLLHNDSLLYAALKWGSAGLLMLFLGFVVFGMLYSGVHFNNNCTAGLNTTYPPGMPGGCHTPFGTILGVYEHTFVYSNCNDDYVSIKDAYMNLTVPVTDSATGLTTVVSKRFYTGLEWQCVEFARRYWMMNGRPEPAYFGSVDMAADIWNLTVVHRLANTSQTLPLYRYKSGDRVVQDGLKAPEAGDIIIYPIQPGGLSVGHVAVITRVELAENGFIYVAEQNWGSTQFTGAYHNYSRRIPLNFNSRTTAITLNDPEGKILGWMRYH